MRFLENEIYHVYNRGNNKQQIFFTDSDYGYFLNKLRTEWKPHCEILAWCLMPNHFHIMLLATKESCIEIPSYGGKPMQLLARKIGLSLSSYTQHINRLNKTSGSLFQQKTKAKCISIPEQQSSNNLLDIQSYISVCMHYIHQNPVKAGIVKRMEDWPFSSFADYAGLRKGTLCNKDFLCRLTGYDPATFYQDNYNALDDKSITDLY